MTKTITRIYIGKSMGYKQALDVYKDKVDFEFIENTFSYCWFSGMAEAGLL